MTRAQLIKAQNEQAALDPKEVAKATLDANKEIFTIRQVLRQLEVLESAEEHATSLRKMIEGMIRADEATVHEADAQIENYKQLIYKEIGKKQEALQNSSRLKRFAEKFLEMEQKKQAKEASDKAAAEQARKERAAEAAALEAELSDGQVMVSSTTTARVKKKKAKRATKRISKRTTKKKQKE